MTVAAPGRTVLSMTCLSCGAVRDETVRALRARESSANIAETPKDRQGFSWRLVDLEAAEGRYICGPCMRARNLDGWRAAVLKNGKGSHRHGGGRAELRERTKRGGIETWAGRDRHQSAVERSAERRRGVPLTVEHTQKMRHSSIGRARSRANGRWRGDWQDCELKGTLGRCYVCLDWTYRAPSQGPADKGDWHGDCLQRWQREHHTRTYPPKPGGRPVSSEGLAVRWALCVRRLLRDETWESLAAEHGWSVQYTQREVEKFVKRLPTGKRANRNLRIWQDAFSRALAKDAGV